MQQNKSVFAKGSITFTVDEHRLEYPNVPISAWGVSGLPLCPPSPSGSAPEETAFALNAVEHFGRKVQVEIEAKNGLEHLFLIVPGIIIREYTAFSEAIGVRFEPTAESRKAIEEYIRRFGFVPTDFLRKYPRIPSNHLLQTFPLRSLVAPKPLTPGLPPDPPIVFDVCNLSPTGVLLSTENQLSLLLRAGERFAMALEPRGWFPTQVSFQGMVCRLVDDLNPTNGNLIRYVGVKIVRIDEPNRTAFLDLLADILEQLRQRPVA